MVQIQTWICGPASNICLVEDHIPIQQWAGALTEGGPPIGDYIECLRCGAILENTEEIPEP